MASSKHDPIRHFITWNIGTRDVRFYGSAAALARSFHHVPRNPKYGTIRYFDEHGAIDLTQAVYDHVQQYPHDVDHLLGSPTPDQKAAQQRFIDCINAMLPEPL